MGKMKYNKCRSIIFLENNTLKHCREVSRILNSKNLVQFNHIYRRIDGNDNTKYKKWRDQDVDVVAQDLVICV